MSKRFKFTYIVCICLMCGYTNTEIQTLKYKNANFQIIPTSPSVVEADAHWAVTVRSPATRTRPRSEASIPGQVLVSKGRSSFYNTAKVKITPPSPFCNCTPLMVMVVAPCTAVRPLEGETNAPATLVHPLQSDAVALVSAIRRGP